MNKFAPPKRLQGIEKSVIRQVFDRALPGSLNLGLGEPDLPTPDVIRREAVKAIVEEQNGYTSHAGLPALREKVAAEYPYLGARPERVVITAGSQEALYLALLTLVDEGDEVLLPNPAFVAYPTIVSMAGGTSSYYRLPRENGFAFDIEEFRRALTPRTKVVVCISPSNPTGRTSDAGRSGGDGRCVARSWRLPDQRRDLSRSLLHDPSGRDRCRRFTIGRS